MALYNHLDEFSRESNTTRPVDTGADIPKELNIFSRQESAFLPAGKTFKDLTAEELNKLKSQYRFDYLVPGIYQGITGFGHML